MKVNLFNTQTNSRTQTGKNNSQPFRQVSFGKKVLTAEDLEKALAYAATSTDFGYFTSTLNQASREVQEPFLKQMLTKEIPGDFQEVFHSIAEQFLNFMKKH